MNAEYEKIENDHISMVVKLSKKGSQLKNEQTPVRLELWHHATGIATEAGELLDMVKKVVIYNKPIDLQNAIEELGDLEFYMQGLRLVLGISREDTLRANIEKLAIRYKGHNYSDEQAQQRKDKQGE